MQRRRNQKGSVMLEFALAGVVSITALFSTVQMCLGMWHYHTLAYSVHETTRKVSVHGRGCVTGTTLCPITIATIVSNLATDSIGVPANSINVTFTTDSGAVTTCNPITACTNNSTRWPPSSNLDKATGKKFTITATYQYNSTMLSLWPGAVTQRLGAFVFPASSTETIVF